MMEAIPYLIIILIVKYFIINSIHILICTVALSFIWFVILQFYIHTTSIYRNQLNRLLNKIITK